MSEYLPYLDESLSFEERARDLVSRMTVEECASQLLYTAGAVPRLGVPEYNWWNEALHGVARAGLGTVFPQAIGLAATFDRDLVEEAADVISTEGRAKYNENVKRGDRGIYKGLTFWSPNVNIFRDPCWGRGQETYGEDPYLTGVLGSAFVKGLQGDDPRYLKAAGCAKHFAVHSGPEKLRHEFDARVSEQEMEETYLPQFKMLLDAGVEGFMGAYNRVNGEPACGSETLLKKILREKWGFDGYITSDCWAIRDFHEHHHATDTPLESVQLALKNGCNVNCGCMYEYLMMAYEAGMISEEDIRESAYVMMRTRMRLGMFDRETPWDGLGILDVDTKAHRALNLRAARESLVLLKNNGLLPLDPKKVRVLTVTGPNADSTVALNGNYHGVAGEYVTVLEGLRAAFPDSRIFYEESFHQSVQLDKDSNLAELSAMAGASDLVVVVTGLDETIEGEEDMGGPRLQGDRESLRLPAIQEALLKSVSESGKPFVIVNMTGSATDFGEAGEKAAAIIQAWYPGALGGRAVAELLTGAFSPAGRLPVTFYRDGNDLPDFCDYSMKGRTYKYFEGTPLYPFGYGLSYTNFEWSGLSVDAGQTAESVRRDGLRASVRVRNTGSTAGDAVAEFYVKDLGPDRPMKPLYRFAGFKRLPLVPGEEREVFVTVPAALLSEVTEGGERVLNPGAFRIYAGGQQPDPRSEELSGEKVLSLDFTL